VNRKALREMSELTHEYHAFGLESEELVKKAILALIEIRRRDDHSLLPQYFVESA
jgi:hypothetical protein